MRHPVPRTGIARPLRGFTLVELLVALLVMSLLAIMSWRGIDGMARTTAITQARADALVALQNSLAQWGADLDAVVDFARIQSVPQGNENVTPGGNASGGNPQNGQAQGPGAMAGNGDTPVGLHWNGQVMRIVRTAAGDAHAGVRVVAWSLRPEQGRGRWLRWQSELLRSPSDLQAAWAQAAMWAQNPDDAARQRELVLLPLLDWKIYFYRNDAWSNPLSSSEAGNALPDGVRLRITLPEDAPLAGVITRDWIRSTVAGNKA